MRKTVYFIPGDGIGPELWAATRPLVNLSVEKAYGGENSIEWRELLAGDKALEETGELLPQSTIDTLRGAELAIKGPLSTPVGKGFRSLNVTLRQVLDLYACIRPVKYLKGTPSPVKRPEDIDMIIYRENTEDVYAGIEYKSGSSEAKRLIEFLRSELVANVDMESAIGIKPMTPKGSKRLIRKALEYAVKNKKPSVTMMHKGNIMKFTEGGFREWGYELAAAEFSASVISESDAAEKPDHGKVIIKDRIADAMFQFTLLKPSEYSVIASPNLNGDYISDALAAQAGGLGMAPGVNMSDGLAFFEATHGTAPARAGKDMANPSSLILSSVLMLQHMGWTRAAELIYSAMEQALAAKTVTYDLARQMSGATEVGCSKFGEILMGYVQN